MINGFITDRWGENGHTAGMGYCPEKRKAPDVTAPEALMFHPMATGKNEDARPF